MISLWMRYMGKIYNSSEINEQKKCKIWWKEFITIGKPWLKYISWLVDKVYPYVQIEIIFMIGGWYITSSLNQGFKSNTPLLQKCVN